MYYLLNIAKWLRKIWLYKILRRKTAGVRVILHRNEEVFLIKHPYDTFWVLPGGGINKNETDEAAAKREVMEETPYKITEIQKLGIYRNNTGGKDDIVHVFTSNKFTDHHGTKNILDKLEIQNMQWFPLNNLPAISKATHQRIHEHLNHDHADTLRPWLKK